MLGLVEEDPSTLTPFDHGCRCLNGHDTTEIHLETHTHTHTHHIIYIYIYMYIFVFGLGNMYL